MAKVGLVTPGLPEKNFTQDVLNNMQKQGTAGVGKVFVGPMNITAPVAKPITAVPIADQYTPPSDLPNKIVSISQAVGSIGKEIFVPSLKNIWGLVSNPFELASREVRDIQFKNAHNGQDKLTYYTNIANDIRNEYRNKNNQLTQDLQTGAINKTQYDQQAADLYNQYNTQLLNAQDKYKQAKLEKTGYRDWQTGQYKENASIGDIWNIIDAGITLSSIGTGGVSRAATMNSVKNGVTKTTGDFLVDSLEKIGAKKLATTIGTIKSTPTATKVANSIDNIVNTVINKNPTFRNYAERQITKLGGDTTARKFFTNATAELLWRAPLRNQNMVMARDIYDSILNSEFTKTPEGKSWLSSGIGQSLLLGSQLLEGGPLYPIYKLVQVGKEFRLAAFGDEAVKAFGELDAAVLKGMNNQEVVNYLTQLSKNEKYGTLLDYFMRGISGTDNAIDSYKYLSENKELIPLFKAFVASNVNTPERLQASLAGILKDMDALYTRNGVRWTSKEAFDRLINYARASEVADQITQKLVASGKLTPGTRGIAITFSREEQARVIQEISNIMTDISKQSKNIPNISKAEVLTLQKEAAVKYIAKAQRAGEYWAQHDGMMADLANNINNAQRAFSGKTGKGNSVVNAIKNINTEIAFKGAPRNLINQMKKLGYVYSSPEKVVNPWYTVAETANTQLQSLVLGEAKKGAVKLLGVNNKVARDVASELLGADIAAVRGAQPQFKRIGNMLTAAGLSPQEAGKEAYRLIHTNAINHIDDIQIAGRNLPKEGTTILNDLYAYMNDPKGTWFKNQITKSLTDLRLMTQNEIAKATGLSGQAAKEIQRAILQSHIDVPLAIRGLGDKVVDYALKNPLQRVYQRLQGVLRYSWNPFFRVQEVTETKTLAAGLSQGQTLLGLKNRIPIYDIVPESKVVTQNPLVTKAQNYKTVNEFINSFGVDVYHGTNADIKSISQLKTGKKISESGKNLLYVSSNPEYAKTYGKNVLKGKVTGDILDIRKDFGTPYEPFIPTQFSDYKTSKILNSTDKRVMENVIASGTAQNYIFDYSPNINKYFLSKGYAGIKLPRVEQDLATGVGNEIIIFGGNLKSYEQLTKIFNQSKKIVAPVTDMSMEFFNPKTQLNVQDIVKLMEDYRILEGSRFGEGATNVAMGRLRADITRFQKNDLARYVDYMAQKMTNGDVEALLRDHSAEVIDNIRPIVQYPTRGVLNSNLARAVNLAIFPARYNVKVAALTTKILSQQSPIVQAAVIRGIADMGQWLQTPEGLAWKQDYANEIAMFKWLSPIGNLDWTFKTLLGNFNSWRDIGLIGGLPFGVWTQILTNQGILPEQPPYVDPKTGTIYSRKVPETMKGRMAMAIMDMLGSIYTYPGRTLMLPSKSKINREIAYNITGASRGDISTRNYTPQDLSEKSRREQQFWYNRANAPQPRVPSVKEYIDTNIKNPTVVTTLSQPTLQKYTKSQIRQAQQATKRSTTGKRRKGKIPVPFEQLVQQSKAK